MLRVSPFCTHVKRREGGTSRVSNVSKSSGFQDAVRRTSRLGWRHDPMLILNQAGALKEKSLLASFQRLLGCGAMRRKGFSLVLTGKGLNAHMAARFKFKCSSTGFDSLTAPTMSSRASSITALTPSLGLQGIGRPRR